MADSHRVDTMQLADAGQRPAVALTPPDLIRLEYLAVPASLEQFITTFYLFRCDEREIRDVQPAAVGQLMVFLHGQGEMAFPGGHRDPSWPQAVLTPQTRACEFAVKGPMHVFGAVLSPLGWAALTGLDAGAWCNRLLQAEQVFGEDVTRFGDAVRAAYAAATDMDGADLVPLATQFLSAHLKPVAPGHVQLMACVADWLAGSLRPDLEALYARCPMSRRQIQRLVLRYFGSNPTQLARKYRALRVVALMGEGDLDEAEAAALIDNFYDQPHMIREIREFVGRTPARLKVGDAPILENLIDVRNFREITPRVAPLPKVEKRKDDA